MAYWIIVAVKDKKDPNVSGEAKWAKRKEDCFWGVPETARGAKEINAGDKALFYLGAPAKCLIGPVQVLSTIHNLTPKEKSKLWTESVAFTANQGFFFRADDEDLGQVVVPELVKKVDLSFIKNKKNWQFSFHTSALQITESDYKKIVKAMSNEPDEGPSIFQDLREDLVMK
jgi:predicted RNA-binding protein